ncbi:MAG: bifunctional transaldolase/phosoglucose isomerase [Thermoanaerobaculia bacterium]
MRKTKIALPERLSAEVRARVAEWQLTGKVGQLWARDASLWTNGNEASWLGWLDIVGQQGAEVEPLLEFSREIQDDELTDVVVLGMGGSSLCPEVLSQSFGPQEGHPRLQILDSTDPGQILTLVESLHLETTLFIVSSKSGTTLEPNVFLSYFLEKMRQQPGVDDPAQHFVAITDPGSALQTLAETEGFRSIFFGVPEIGGRFSALSNFGMVPAAVMGLDQGRLLARAGAMTRACAETGEGKENPGLLLGAVIGESQRLGRDKLTLVCSPGIRDLGAWLEQLVAESTGKDGKAVIPVDREELGPADSYGEDRLFAHLRLDEASDLAQDEAVERLIQAGQPVVQISLADRYDLAGEFFRWEFATAVAGSIMGVDPFNQPDVEASKLASKRLTDAYEQTGSLPVEEPLLRDERSDLILYADDQNREALRAQAGGNSLVEWLRAHFERLGPGDYFALLAYLEMNEDHERELQAIRHTVRDRYSVATCLGFGPRFLHSTGQAYKGGPNSGVFLQITGDERQDLPIPGRQYTFGIVEAAQAGGDLVVLEERGRRALRIHLRGNPSEGLAELRRLALKALD